MKLNLTPNTKLGRYRKFQTIVCFTDVLKTVRHSKHVRDLTDTVSLPFPDDAKRLHGGPLRNSYMEQSFHGLNPVLGLPVSLRAVEQAETNAGLTGAPLLRWIDSLLEGHWGAADVCSMGPSTCPVMQRCHRTSWSSASPDPKSELIPPTQSGRIR